MTMAMVAAVFFALTGVCARQAIALLGVPRANLWRIVVALGIFMLVAVPSLWGGVDIAAGWFVLAGALGFGLGGSLMFLALARIGSTLGLLVVECAAALFGLLMGYVVLGAAITLWQMACVVVVLSGVVMGTLPGPLPQLSGADRWRGVGMAAAAAMLQAISFNLSKIGFVTLAERDAVISYPEAAFLRLAGGAVVALVIYRFVRAKRNGTNAVRFTNRSRLWVLGNAVFGPVLGVTAMLWAIDYVANPGLVQTVVATATLWTLPLAWRLENARARWSYYAGAFAAIGGIAGLLLFA